MWKWDKRAWVVDLGADMAYAGAEGSSPLPWLPAKHAEAGNGAGGQGGVS